MSNVMITVHGVNGEEVVIESRVSTAETLIRGRAEQSSGGVIITGGVTIPFADVKEVTVSFT